MFFYRRYITLLLALLVSCAVTALCQVKIHGKVIDQESQPLEFVTIRVAGTAIGTTSGLDGTFKLSAPQTDTITVVFTCIGYEELRRQLIDPKGDLALNVRMRPKDHALTEI